ncbi:MAG: hypothetical protein RI554_04580 [Trueperaceae bacterium]|nr:hypothetical protein [Trueperaceae bacterium]
MPPTTPTASDAPPRPSYPPAGPPDAPGPAPAAWPADHPEPAEVTRRREAWRDAVRARARRHRATDAELVLPAGAHLLKRDDPPRPTERAPSFAPEVAATWAPLRSERLVAEARVLEAERAWRDAWRDALHAALAAPVERARLEVERADARAALAGGDPDDARDAALDLRIAEADLVALHRDAHEALAPLRSAGPDAAQGGRTPPASWPVLADVERPALTPPPAPPAAATLHVRARVARALADVARSERRRTAALLPHVGLEVGYAGRHAETSGSVELRAGRPEAEVRARARGTPRERAWVDLEASVRFGSDAGRRTRDLEDARRDLERARERATRDVGADVTEARNDLDVATARWRAAEAARAAAWSAGRPDAGALDDARRDWLRYLREAMRDAEAREGWPTPAGTPP